MSGSVDLDRATKFLNDSLSFFETQGDTEEWKVFIGVIMKLSTVKDM